MAELLADAAAWLGGQHKQHNSRSVTYRRGGESVALQATVGRTEYEQTDAEGVTTFSRIRDFLLTASDLDFGGGPVLPELGDVIEETQSGTTFTYAVLVDPSGEHFRWSDPFRTVLRIHTREIGEAEA